MYTQSCAGRKGQLCIAKISPLLTSREYHNRFNKSSSCGFDDRCVNKQTYYIIVTVYLIFVLYFQLTTEPDVNGVASLDSRLTQDTVKYLNTNTSHRAADDENVVSLILSDIGRFVFVI